MRAARLELALTDLKFRCSTIALRTRLPLDFCKVQIHSVSNGFPREPAGAVPARAGERTQLDTSRHVRIVRTDVGVRQLQLHLQASRFSYVEMLANVHDLLSKLFFVSRIERLVLRQVELQSPAKQTPVLGRKPKYRHLARSADLPAKGSIGIYIALLAAVFRSHRSLPS